MDGKTVIGNMNKSFGVMTVPNLDHLSDDDAKKLLEKKIHHIDDVLPNSKQGLLNVRALFFLVLWYFFSGCTLFLNKYILTYMNGDPTVLGKISNLFFSFLCFYVVKFFAGTFQMLMTTVCGFIQLYFPCGMYKPAIRSARPPGFFRHMMLVGCTR